MDKIFNLHLFDANTQTTTTAGLSDEMKTYYSKYLITLAKPLLVHDQFGQMQDIPNNGGKTIEFRKFDSFPKALTPLTEGVTPDGRGMNVTKITSTISQYGDYVTLSDVLMMTAIDKVQVEAADLLASQAGLTLDTVTREVLNGGTSVQYVGSKASRSLLESTSKITVKEVKTAVAALKRVNAPKIGGYYVGIIHPDVTFDLTEDNDWKYPHQYVDTQNIYSGEIGSIAGVRFVETSEAKIFTPFTIRTDSDGKAYTYVTTASYASKVITFDETITSAEATALVGKSVLIKGVPNVVSAATTSTLTLTDTPAANPVDGDVIYAAGGAKNGESVYSTLILGQNAYGVTKVEGLGLQYISKQLGAGDDPLNQRATAGWKASKTAERLVEQYMVRIESCSTFSSEAN